MVTGTAVTIGNFDGVHAGHRALVRRARHLVGPDGRVVVMAFDPHPATLLRPGTEPGRLTTFERRRELLAAEGADEVVRLTPSPEFLARSASAFIDAVCAEHAPGWFVEGPDFRFGRGREGTPAVLAELGRSRGFAVDVVRPARVVLTDQSIVTASSTLARWLIGHGRVRDAAFVLGRCHGVEGVVIRGDRRGRTIGLPTANIDARTLCPGDGVYAGRAILPDGRGFAAAVHVGPRPTLNGLEHRVEAHFVGVGPLKGGRIPGLDEYGWSLRLEFVSFLRDACRFGSVDELAGQIRRDAARAAALVGRSGLPPTTSNAAVAVTGRPADNPPA